MAPIPPSSISDDDKNLWKSYLTNATTGNIPEQFRSDAPKCVDGMVPAMIGPTTAEMRPLRYYEIQYNGSTLKFTVDMFGKQPDSGFPVYIFLHGGGSSTVASDPEKVRNSSDWYYNAYSNNGTYRASVAAKVAADKAKGTDVGAMYIAARGLTSPDRNVPDTWDLHWTPNSFVLYTKLIRQLIRPSPFATEDSQRMKQESLARDSSYTLSNNPLNFVDPNQVYITGFSAGGDGVYHLATSLADHFSAANMSAGHPGGARFQNLANVAFSMQVGALDVFYWRSKLAVENFLLLQSWKKRLPENYVTSCSIHKTSSLDPSPDNDPNHEDAYGWRHNSWEYAEGGSDFNRKSQVFKQTGNVLKNWLEQVQKCTTSPNWNADTDAEAEKLQIEWQQVIDFYTDGKKVTSDDSVLDTINTNVIKWCGELQDPTKGTKPRLRDPNPSTVIWNLRSRPSKPNLIGNTAWIQQKFFYWLYIRDTKTEDYKPFKDKNDIDLVIRVDRNGNTIFVNQPYNFLGILLNENMFDFSKPIQVIIPSKAATNSDWSDPNNLPSGLDSNNCIKLDPVKVGVVRKIKEETLQARGDLNYMFSAVLSFSDKSGKWQVKAEATLHPNGVSPLMEQ